MRFNVCTSCAVGKREGRRISQQRHTGEREATAYTTSLSVRNVRDRKYGEQVVRTGSKIAILGICVPSTLERSVPN